MHLSSAPPNDERARMNCINVKRHGLGSLQHFLCHETDCTEAKMPGCLLAAGLFSKSLTDVSKKKSREVRK
jgi:hypothetical protein